MKVKLTYEGPSVRGKSDVYKITGYGSLTVILYAPRTATPRPALELDVPDWWLNKLTPPILEE